MDRECDLIAAETCKNAASRLTRAYEKIRESFMEEYGYDADERVRKFRLSDGTTDACQIFYRTAYSNHIEMQDDDFAIKKKSVSSFTDGGKKN